MSVNIYENGSLKGIAGVSLAPENIFTGTKQEYDIAYADGKIKDGMIINITDDYETINPIGKDNILGTMEQINANTDEDKLAGATAVKELSEEVSQLNSDLNDTNNCLANIDVYNNTIVKTITKNLGKIFNGNSSINIDHGIKDINTVLSWNITMNNGITSYTLPYYDDNILYTYSKTATGQTVNITANNRTNWADYDVILTMRYI